MSHQKIVHSPSQSLSLCYQLSASELSPTCPAHLPKLHTYGGILDQAVHYIFLAGVALDLITHFCKLIFNRHQIFQCFRLCRKLDQPLFLGAQAFQPGFHIHILAGHILGGFPFGYQIARSAGTVLKFVVMVAGHTEGVFYPAGTLLLAAAFLALLHIGPGILRGGQNGLLGFAELLALQ